MSTQTSPIVSPRLRTVDKIRLGIEILDAYRIVRHSLAARPLPETVELLRSPGRRRARVLADPHRDGVRLGRAVTRMLDRPPVRAVCLGRSLVLLRLLAARGAAGELVISAVPRAPALDAHAWIELDGRPLLPPGPEHARLVML